MAAAPTIMNKNLKTSAPIIKTIKLKIIREADPPETLKVDEFNRFLPECINSDEETGVWIDLPDSDIRGIIEAIKQLDEGKGIPHNQVMKRIREKYLH